ncbi:MAG TPA: ATP synthase F0 subunit B [Terriglobales bacterium]|nr:ATP synthase F0 subunit B [Terriglobales bacterium]
MKRLLLLTVFLLMAGVAFAQAHPEPAKSEPTKAEPAKTPTKAAETKAESPADEHKASGEGHEGAQAGEHAETKEAEADPHAQFTQSPSVKFIGKTLGVETKTAYWISVLLNFAILAGAIIWLSRTGVPAMFRNRTLAIQKGMEEARKASAESAARLGEIESRLAKLDQDIATMRTQAETEAKAEEDRLRAATEEEKRKIVQSAEQEIAAAASSARRDLKNLAAELAVSLAEKKISVSEATDRVLVRDFAAGLGADAKGRS